eukprot:scaffold539_cov187-Ochromonas_danica.AAC.30
MLCYTIIGCSLKEHLPVIVDDENFIALLHFTSKHCISSPSTATTTTTTAVEEEGEDDNNKLYLTAMQFLAHVSGHIVGEFKSVFFMEKCYPLFERTLCVGQLPPTPLPPQLAKVIDSDDDHQAVVVPTTTPTATTAVVFNELKQELLWYSMRLLRIIASVHPKSNEELAHSPIVLPLLMNLIQHDELPEPCLREALILLNTLIGGHVNVKNRWKRETLTLPFFMKISKRRLLSVYDSLLEILLTCYESDLPYDDSRHIYRIEGIEEGHHNELVTVFDTLLTDLIDAVYCHRGEDIIPYPYELGITEGGAGGGGGGRMPAITFLARSLDKVERSLQIISNPRVFLSIKHRLLKLLKTIFALPQSLPFHDIAAIDILLLLYRGSARCWSAYAMDPLDHEFLHLSQRLVEDFLNVTSQKKIFDERDHNTLYYLAGSDDQSSIPEIIEASSLHALQGSSSHCQQWYCNNSRGSSGRNEHTTSNTTSNTTSASASSPLLNKKNLSGLLDNLNLLGPNTSNKKVLTGTIGGGGEEEGGGGSVEDILEELYHLLNHLLLGSRSLHTIVIEWEHHSNETNCHKLVYLHLISSLIGWDKMQYTIAQADQLPTHILNLLAEDRFFIKSIPGLEKLCIEVLGNAIEAMGSFEQATEFSVYLIKLITSKPDGLATDASNISARSNRRGREEEEVELHGHHGSDHREEFCEENPNDIAILMRSSSMGSPHKIVMLEEN